MSPSSRPASGNERPAVQMTEATERREPSDPEILRRPEPGAPGSQVAEFVRWLESERELTIGNYGELWEWSVTDLAGFWSAVSEFFDVIWREPFRTVLSGVEMPDVEWFPGGRINYAEHTLRRTGASPAVLRLLADPRTLPIELGRTA